MKCLINLGADISRVDAEGNGMVNLAAMRFHTNVLEHLIEWSHEKAPVWKILVSKYFDLEQDICDVYIHLKDFVNGGPPWPSG